MNGMNFGANSEWLHYCNTFLDMLVLLPNLKDKKTNKQKHKQVEKKHERLYKYESFNLKV